MTRQEFLENTSAMTKNQKYMCADVVGRAQVMIDLSMMHPDWKIVNMPLYCPYDLEVYDKNGNLLYYIEVKDRWDYERNKLDSALLNIPKYEGAKDKKDKWLFANVWGDGLITYFKPYDMPETGITEDIFCIQVSTVEDNEKIPQKRLKLNFNDAFAEHQNKIEINFRKNDGHNKEYRQNRPDCSGILDQDTDNCGTGKGRDN